MTLSARMSHGWTGKGNGRVRHRGRELHGNEGGRRRIRAMPTEPPNLSVFVKST
jgi:hypothetical protein